MNLNQIIDELSLTVLTPSADLSQTITDSGYASDLLSCVMSGATSGCIWITLQCHSNIVAVAALLDIAAIIITEDAQPDHATVEKAIEEGVILLSTPMSTFETNGKLWALGIRAAGK